MKVGLALAAMVLLAGCAADAPDPEVPPAFRYVERTPPPEPAPLPCERFGGQTVLVGAGTVTPTQPHHGVAPFDAVAQMVVPPNTTALVLDLWWDQGATAGVRSQVRGPGTDVLSDARLAATETDPLRVRIDAPAPGTWTWRALADPAAVGVVVHFQEGLYRLAPEQAGFACNEAGA